MLWRQLDLQTQSNTGMICKLVILLQGFFFFSLGVRLIFCNVCTIVIMILNCCIVHIELHYVFNTDENILWVFLLLFLRQSRMEGTKKIPPHSSEEPFVRRHINPTEDFSVKFAQ